ncbi:MAG: hypothetical protein KDH90_14595 [Anaerolineae bacterium]|nr:hypothetical protein [Anaerolineae bacterium]
MTATAAFIFGPSLIVTDKNVDADWIAAITCDSMARQNLADTNDATFRLELERRRRIIIPGDVTYCNGTLRVLIARVGSTVEPVRK